MTDYHDIDGNPITLPKLCRTEPEWATNRIRDLSAERDTAEANLERLQNKFEQVTGENGRLSAEVTRLAGQCSGLADAAINNGKTLMVYERALQRIAEYRAIECNEPLDDVLDIADKALLSTPSGIHHPDHEAENSMCACPSCIDEGWKQQAAVDGRESS